MADTSYYLANSSDLIVVNGDRATYPDIAQSATNTFEFSIKEPIQNARTSTKTVYDTANTTYNRFKEYQEFAGYAATSQTLKETAFSESKDFTAAPVDGLVISVQPGDDVDKARGVWGIIESIDDTTEVFGAVARISLDLFVLAEYEDYATESDVRNALEADL